VSYLWVYRETLGGGRRREREKGEREREGGRGGEKGGREKKDIMSR